MNNRYYTRLTFLLFTLLTYDTFAQQDPYLTHHNFNQLLINPAVAGSKQMTCFTGVHHRQWVGLQDRTIAYQPGEVSKEFVGKVNPVTTGITGHTFFPTSNRNLSLGIGASILQDDIGYESSTKIRLNGAVRFAFSENSFLSFGLSAGFHQKEVDGNKFFYHDPNDPNIPRAVVSDGQLDLGLGVLYRNTEKNNLSIGLSSTQIGEQTFNYNSGTMKTRAVRHYYLLSSIEKPIQLMGHDLQYQPNLLLKASNTLQATFTNMVEYNGVFSGGLGYRTENDALALLCGYRFKSGVRLGYSYDITLQGLRRFSYGSHEIQFNYCIPMPTGIDISPRYLNKDPGQWLD